MSKHKEPCEFQSNVCSLCEKLLSLWQSRWFEDKLWDIWAYIISLKMQWCLLFFVSFWIYKVIFLLACYSIFSNLIRPRWKKPNTWFSATTDLFVHKNILFLQPSCYHFEILSLLIFAKYVIFLRRGESFLVLELLLMRGSQVLFTEEGRNIFTSLCMTFHIMYNIY